MKGKVNVLAFDVYNMADTRGVSKTLNSIATDTDHIPVVCLESIIVLNDQGGQ